MKRILTPSCAFALISFLTLGTTFCSCGFKTEGDNSNVDTTRYDLAREGGPEHDDARQLPTQTISFAGHEYKIDISIAPSDSLPQVKDSYGDPYLDNEVLLCVTADGAVVVKRNFVKSDFVAAANGLNTSKLILGGMAFNSIDISGLHFGAQLNEPGDLEGGYAFKVTLPVAGGAPTVVRDTSVDEAVEYTD